MAVTVGGLPVPGYCNADCVNLHVCSAYRFSKGYREDGERLECFVYEEGELVACRPLWNMKSCPLEEVGND